jgi:hypothetical protein
MAISTAEKFTECTKFAELDAPSFRRAIEPDTLIKPNNGEDLRATPLLVCTLKNRRLGELALV